MLCRCGEIASCNADRQVLQRAKTKASNLFTEVNAIQNQLNLLINYSSSAYTADNNEEICDTIDDLNDDIGPALSQLLSAIQNKDNELLIRLSGLKREDRIYHENERLKELKRRQNGNIQD